MVADTIIAAFLACISIATQDIVTDDEIHVAVVQCAITTNYHGDIEEYLP